MQTPRTQPDFYRHNYSISIPNEQSSVCEYRDRFSRIGGEEGAGGEMEDAKEGRGQARKDTMIINRRTSWKECDGFVFIFSLKITAAYIY